MRLSPGAALSIPTPGNSVADEEESEAVSASSCPASSQKDRQVNTIRKYLLVGLANQEGLALPRGKRKGSVSAEPLFGDFFQQGCSQLHSKIYHAQSHGADALNPATP